MALRRVFGSMSWRALAAVLGGVAATLVLLLALEAVVERRAADRARTETARIAMTLRSQMEQDLTATILLQKGLAAQFATNPDMTSAEFEAFARDLLIGARHVRNLGVSHGTVIADVYPRDGNNASAIGTDYRTLADQWPTIERAIASRSSQLTGPARLVQGGMGLIGRTPVFRSPPAGTPGSGEFLGIVSVVIDLASLWSRLNFPEIEATHSIALRGVDARGAEGAVFYGDAALFERDGTILDVLLPGGSWKLALAPRPGGAIPPELVAARWFGIAAALLAGLATFLVVRYVEQGRRARRRLAESEARFRDFAESSADWFWETGPDHRFIWMSVQAEGVIGRAVDTVLGQRCVEFADGDAAAPLWSNHLEDLAARRAFRDFVFPAGTARGTRWIRASGVPVMAPDGAFLGYRGSASDITEREGERARLAEALNQAEAANMAKSSFLAQMSHELRTPLNAIIGFAEIISGQLFGTNAADRYRSYAGDILASGRHLLSLVNDLLDIGRIESGELRIQTEEIALPALVAEAVGMISPSAEKAGLAVDVDMPELPKLDADPRALMQILVNLLTNAVKFTPPGGRVRVSAKLESAGSLLISVADTGVGIDPEDLARVLRPFEQVESPFVRERGGAGLGLPIAKGLMQGHGGTLTIESWLGGGTIVTCRFPSSRIRSSRTRQVAG